MNAVEAFDKLLTLPFETVLDVGSGTGSHALAFAEAGKTVSTINLFPPADYVGDYVTYEVPKTDCIWASHVLEHQENVGLFLSKCYDDLKDDGILAITVPPAKPEIVGGHLTLWNAGLLIYNLILAGFDCSQAMVKTYGYNISVIVRKKPAFLPGLLMDNGDIETLSVYFPFPAVEGFNGSVMEWNW